MGLVAGQADLPHTSRCCRTSSSPSVGPQETSVSRMKALSLTSAPVRMEQKNTHPHLLHSCWQLCNYNHTGKGHRRMSLLPGKTECRLLGAHYKNTDAVSPMMVHFSVVFWVLSRNDYGATDHGLSDLAWAQGFKGKHHMSTHKKIFPWSCFHKLISWINPSNSYLGFLFEGASLLPWNQPLTAHIWS